MTGLTADARSVTIKRRLHLNESPYPPSATVLEAIAAAAARVNRYPEQDDAALMAALADYCGAPAGRIVLTSGSNELLHLLPLIACGAGAEMVVTDPSFPTYRKVAAFYGISVRGVPVNAPGAADVDAIRGAITPACRLVCVPSPNNPTGGLLSGEEIVDLATGVPETMLLHFDEAYYEFGRQAGGVETLPLLARRSGPWIASRSFSKAFGLAGLRLGYSIASSEELAQRCRSLRPNFSVNALAQAAGLAALHDRAHAETMISAIAAERRRLQDGLAEMGFAPLPSAANFVAFPIPPDAGDLVACLASHGILVSPFDLPERRPAIRVTVGTGEDTDALFSALTRKRQV